MSPGSAHPPLGVSLSRGLYAVGSSPLLLVSAFLASLALWLGFSGYGVILAASPAAMVLLEALPPVHSFLDIQFLFSGRTVSGATVLLFGVALILLRAALMSFWVSLLVDRFERAESPESGESTLRRGLPRAVRGVLPMVGLEAGFFLLSTIGLLIIPGFLGAAFGQIGVIAVLIGGLYFFGFAPIAAVSEGIGPVSAARSSVEAARLPGRRHMALVLAYLGLSIFLSITTPPSRVATATPSLLVWAYVLFVGFLHVSVLGALVYRWLAVRDSLTIGTPVRSAARRVR